MRVEKPEINLQGEDAPVELKIPPRECTMCGAKYIPSGPRQKLCPDCRNAGLRKKKTSKLEKDTAWAFGKAVKSEVETPEDGIHLAVETRDPFEPVNVSVTAEELQAEALPDTMAAPESAPYSSQDIAAALSRLLGAEVFAKEQLEPVTIWIADREAFYGYVRRAK